MSHGDFRFRVTTGHHSVTSKNMVIEKLREENGCTYYYKISIYYVSFLDRDHDLCSTLGNGINELKRLLYLSIKHEFEILYIFSGH